MDGLLRKSTKIAKAVYNAATNPDQYQNPPHQPYYQSPYGPPPSGLHQGLPPPLPPRPHDVHGHAGPYPPHQHPNVAPPAPYAHAAYHGPPTSQPQSHSGAPASQWQQGQPAQPGQAGTPTHNVSPPSWPATPAATAASVPTVAPAQPNISPGAQPLQPSPGYNVPHQPTPPGQESGVIVSTATAQPPYSNPQPPWGAQPTSASLPFSPVTNAASPNSPHGFPSPMDHSVRPYPPTLNHSTSYPPHTMHHPHQPPSTSHGFPHAPVPGAVPGTVPGTVSGAPYQSPHAGHAQGTQHFIAELPAQTMMPVELPAELPAHSDSTTKPGDMAKPPSENQMPKPLKTESEESSGQSGRPSSHSVSSQTSGFVPPGPISPQGQPLHAASADTSVDHLDQPKPIHPESSAEATANQIASMTPLSPPPAYSQPPGPYSAPASLQPPHLHPLAQSQVPGQTLPHMSAHPGMPMPGQAPLSAPNVQMQHQYHGQPAIPPPPHGEHSYGQSPLATKLAQHHNPYGQHQQHQYPPQPNTFQQANPQYPMDPPNAPAQNSVPPHPQYSYHQPPSY